MYQHHKNRKRKPKPFYDLRLNVAPRWGRFENFEHDSVIIIASNLEPFFPQPVEESFLGISYAIFILLQIPPISSETILMV